MISATQFRNAPVTFDYVHHILTFEDSTSLAARKAGTTQLPLLLQDFGHGQSGLCEIDTGSQGFFLDHRFAARLGLDPNATKGRIDSISLHGAPQTVLTKPAVRFENLIYDCNVGNDFWDHRSFTLDIPDHAIYV